MNIPSPTQSTLAIEEKLSYPRNQTVITRRRLLTFFTRLLRKLALDKPPRIRYRRVSTNQVNRCCKPGGVGVSVEVQCAPVYCFFCVCLHIYNLYRRRRRWTSSFRGHGVSASSVPLQILLALPRTNSFTLIGTHNCCGLWDVMLVNRGVALSPSCIVSEDCLFKIFLTAVLNHLLW